MEIILTLVGGLVLFLYGVGNLSDSIKEAANDKMKKIVVRFTKNIFSAIVVGTVVTTILDSSSAVIILTIVLVNAKILNFRQAVGIVMGANIGTTISSQIIAMDVGQYSPILLFIGFLLMLISKSEKINTVGRIALFFGMLFFGLFTMERAVEPLKGSEQFSVWMANLENPLYGAAVGALVTLVIQSSSATVGMVITLAKQNLITLPAGIAVMLGAELGTCSDTLLATIRSNRQAIKTGVFHLFFNLVSIIIGLILFAPFMGLVEYVSGQADLENKIANAHVLFNVLGVVLFVGFVPIIVKVLDKLIPDNQQNEDLVAESKATA
ncbi:MAG: Na/Pi symporter [Acidobacteriota bacterium]|nr:Na/Pi symporter [Acidobacteriota bacterium]